MALLQRHRTGHGQHIHISMLDSVVAFMWPEAMAAHTFISGIKPNPNPNWMAADTFISVIKREITFFHLIDASRHL